MKTKILCAVYIGVLVVSPMLWAIDAEPLNPSDAVMPEQTIHASGTVKSIADNHESVRIFHNPIPELRWASMTMPFNASNHVLIDPLNVGDKVDFEFIQKDGKNIIVRIKKQ